jgi:hypothetical protein
MSFPPATGRDAAEPPEDPTGGEMDVVFPKINARTTKNLAPARAIGRFFLKVCKQVLFCCVGRSMMIQIGEMTTDTTRPHSRLSDEEIKIKYPPPRTILVPGKCNKRSASDTPLSSSRKKPSVVTGSFLFRHTNEEGLMNLPYRLVAPQKARNFLPASQPPTNKDSWWWGQQCRARAGVQK